MKQPYTTKSMIHLFKLNCLKFVYFPISQCQFAKDNQVTVMMYNFISLSITRKNIICSIANEMKILLSWDKYEGIFTLDTLGEISEIEYVVRFGGGGE